MSFPYTPRPQDEKLESLQTQHKYLNILRLRHLQWSNSTNDPQTERVHLEIAGQIEEIGNRYKHLLEELEQQGEPG